MNHARLAVSRLAFVALAAISGSAMADVVKLTGAHEVPPVQTAAQGSGEIKISADGAVSGKVSTTGLAGTAAHIHVAAEGTNGPVAIPLTKSGESDWVVPEGAKLSAEQLKAYREGKLYVNVHTEAHKGGEIRSQLKP